MQKKRFTSTELLAVTAAVALHAALLAPTLSGIREQARRSACANNLRQLGNALANCERDLDAFPEADTSSAVFRTLLEDGHLSGADILSCPSNPMDVDLEDWMEGMSYYVDPRTPRRRHPMRALAADRNLYGDWSDNHGEDGVNVLFGSDRVQFVRAGEGTGNPPESGKIGNPHLARDGNIYESAQHGDPEDARIAYSAYRLDDFRVEAASAWVLHSTYTGTVTPEMAGERTVIVIGGGGGGGGFRGGGGGAGGVVIQTDVTLNTGDSFTVTVGQGGAGGRGSSAGGRPGADGNPSLLSAANIVSRPKGEEEGPIRRPRETTEPPGVVEAPGPQATVALRFTALRG